MAAPISQKEYLKRYLGGGDDDKKKKKKKKKDKSGSSSKGMRIIEDSLTINDLPYGYVEEDDNPTIAEITYEDEKIKHMEEFEANKKWKKIIEDREKGDGEGNGLQTGERLGEDELPPRRQRHDSHSPSPVRPKGGGRTRHDSDDSPPRRKRHDSDDSPPRRQRHDSDTSPRRERHDSDTSPLKRRHHDSDASPPGRIQDTDSTPPRRKRNDSDVSGNGSPVRRQEISSPKRKRNDSVSSPPRRKRNDSDTSPPRRKRNDSDTSPPRRKRNDSDTSPPRRKRNDSPPRRKRNDSDTSSPRRKRNDSDTSPPRRNRNDSDTSPPRRKRNDSDSSPPRRKRNDSDASLPRRKRNDSDSSPPRRKRNDSDSSPPRRKRNNSDSSPPRRKEWDTQSAQQLKANAKEDRPERKMTTQEYLRARKFGKLKKDTPEELARKERESVLQKKADEQHQQWKHGVKQMEAYQQKMQDDVHEMGKAFARSADDVDMNSRLKQVTREEDPMLEYMMKKQIKENKQPIKPLYKGPFPPNRLNIRPGYRWDGVDRSNGYENKWFEHQNNKRAHEEDAYKWSVSDM